MIQIHELMASGDLHCTRTGGHEFSLIPRKTRIDFDKLRILGRCVKCSKEGWWKCENKEHFAKVYDKFIKGME